MSKKGNNNSKYVNFYLKIKHRNVKNHDMAILETTHKRLYEENIRYFNKIKEITKFCIANEAYLKKYEVIVKTAERSYNMKKNLLNDMKKFDHNNIEKNQNELNEKRKIYCHLEIEVKQIKDDTVTFQNQMEEIFSLIQTKEKIISDKDEKNQIIIDDIKNYLRQNYEIKIKMLQIYDNLKVCDLESIIKKFREERIQYQGYNSIVIIFFYLVFKFK